MAITNTNTNKRNNAVPVVYTAVTSEGVKIVPDRNDSRTAILLKNADTNPATVNVAPGTSPYKAENALAISVPASSEVVVSLDSALYKDMSFDGYLIESSATKVSVACITLP
jgi:hypothetical protein